MPPGSLVQVTMKTGSGSNKVLRGRLGEISQKSFHLNVAVGNQVSDREIAFEDVKSVRPSATAGSRMRRASRRFNSSLSKSIPARSSRCGSVTNRKCAAAWGRSRRTDS